VAGERSGQAKRASRRAMHNLQQILIDLGRISPAIQPAGIRTPARDYRSEKPTRTLASMSEFERAARESMIFVFFVRVRAYSALAGH
jgi:hypothetical protein